MTDARVRALENVAERAELLIEAAERNGLDSLHFTSLAIALDALHRAELGWAAGKAGLHIVTGDCA
jgi:hypothetical protein